MSDEDKIEILSSWRDLYVKYVEEGKKLEQFAFDNALPIGFEVRPMWPGIDWAEWGSNEKHKGNSILRFQEMVQLTSDVLGVDPDRVSGNSSVLGGGTPDLVAKWRVDDGGSVGVVDITVRVLSPAGCKIDPKNPGTPTAWGEAAKLSDECTSILDQMTTKPKEEK